jgi:gamma-glutamylputrescine oxidase
VVGGDRLMWSGRSTAWRGNPKRYVRPLLKDIRTAYPQLGEVEAEYAWTGVLGNTVHRMPQIGEVSPGFWLLSGFGGHGLNTTAMAGELIARAIVEDDRTWRQFLPFELVWAGGLLGRAATQFYYWGYRTRERIDGRLARERRKKAERAAQKSAPDRVEAAPNAAKN